MLIAEGKKEQAGEGKGRTVVARGNGTEGVMSKPGTVFPAILPLSRKDRKQVRRQLHT